MSNYEGKARTNYVRIDETKRSILNVMLTLTGDTECRKESNPELSTFLIEETGTLWFDLDDLRQALKECKADATVEAGVLGLLHKIDGYDTHSRVTIKREPLHSVQELEDLGVEELGLHSHYVYPHCMSKGQILVYVEAGWEKMRYIAGLTEAYDHNGEMVARIDTHSIYDVLRKEGFNNVTTAEY